MNITRENIDELNAILTVSIEKSDYEATVNDVLKSYRKKANMPGFRPGMVPAGLIRKMYGKAVLAEEVNKIVSKSLLDYIREEKLNVLGEPLPNPEKQPAIDWDNQSDFSFVFDVAMAPDFEVKLDKDLKMPFYSIVADQDIVNKQADAYALHFGENKVVETVGENDSIRGDFVQLDADGNELEGGIRAEQVIIAVDLMKDEEIKASVIGKKAGDVLVFDPVKAYENRHEVGHMLNISHEAAHDLSGEFKFTIVEVLRFEPAEMNTDLFSKVYGEDAEITTADEFKAEIKDEIEKGSVLSSNYKFSIDARDMLVNTFRLALPETFLKRWIKETNEKMTEAQIENDFEHFMNDLRWQLIKDKIAKENDLRTMEEDVRALAREMAELQFREYGLTNVAPEHIESYANRLLQNEDERRRLVSRNLENLVLELVKSKVTLDVKEITYDEFNKMMEN
jgi:trigger factor